MEPHCQFMPLQAISTNLVNIFPDGQDSLTVESGSPIKSESVHPDVLRYGLNRHGIFIESMDMLPPASEGCHETYYVGKQYPYIEVVLLIGCDDYMIFSWELKMLDRLWLFIKNKFNRFFNIENPEQLTQDIIYSVYLSSTKDIKTSLLNFFECCYEYRYMDSSQWSYLTKKLFSDIHSSLTCLIQCNKEIEIYRNNLKVDKQKMEEMKILLKKSGVTFFGSHKPYSILQSRIIHEEHKLGVVLDTKKSHLEILRKKLSEEIINNYI